MSYINPESSVIAVDLGGTNIRSAKILNGRMQDKFNAKLPADKHENAESVIKTIFHAIEQCGTHGIDGIGIGVPSVLDPGGGTICNLQNIRSFRQIHLKSILEDEFHKTVYMNNDANCFAIGEHLFGTGKAYKNFVGLVVGTGVGGGIVNNGSLMKDVNCGSGEFGEVGYLDGRYEDYCSGLFFENKYNTEGGELFVKASNGDTDAQKIFEEFGQHLGKLLKTIVLTIDPEAIIMVLFDNRWILDVSV